MVKRSDIVSKSEAARRLGRSPATISKYLAKGMPCLSTGQLDWQAVQRWVRKNVVSERGGSFQRDELRRNGSARRNGSDRTARDDASLAALMRRKLTIENDTRQLHLLRERAEVIPLAAANAFFSQMIVRCRDRLLRLPGELKDRFDALTGQGCAELLDSELRTILAGLKTYEPPVHPADQQPADAAETKAP